MPPPGDCGEAGGSGRERGGERRREDGVERRREDLLGIRTQAWHKRGRGGGVSEGEERRGGAGEGTCFGNENTSLTQSRLV